MNQHHLLFGKKNFLIVLIGIGLILLGYLVMIGGASTDANVYPEAQIYGFRRTILAPVLVLLGFAAQIVAIFYPVKEEDKILPDTAKTGSTATQQQVKKVTAKTGKK
ncbi:DUF3098 domain-containing protein [Sphingobacteriales bacterium UPWRP_1]|nr:hypothetical protein B6N25_17425 [Sphingobacteriales bacterium TSM_CSS]PSJ72816.1 DUF3098 domain-containing protein [Sphingobacteriales bacterium UPWRP_1]